MFEPRLTLALGLALLVSPLGQAAPSSDAADKSAPLPAHPAAKILGVTSGFPENGVDKGNTVSSDWGNSVNFTTDPQYVVSRGFTAGPLLGNGDVGVTQGGDPDTQVIYISKNGMFRPLGGITITSATKGAETPSSTYEQDISRAEARADVTLSGVPITMRTWTSANENLIVTEITNNSSSPADLRADLWISRSPASQHGRTNPPASFISKAGADKNILWGTRELPLTMQPEGLDTVAKTAIATTVLGAENLSVSGGGGDAFSTFTVPPKQTVFVASYVDGTVGFTPSMPGISTFRNKAVAQARQLDKAGIKTAHQSHLQWWADFWSKSNVVLNDPQMEKFYYGALYALASSSRGGKIAPGLWANWITTEDPFWDGLYFSNYNFQAPFWGVYASNHGELAESFNEQVYGYAPWGKAHAHNAGYPGIDVWRVPPVVSVNLTGYSENLPQTPPIAASRDRKLINDQLSVALLGMVNLVNTYYYGKDKKYLKEQLYPYLKELALFWDSYLVKRDGKYIISESGAREEDGGQSLNSIADLALVKFLYKALIAASQDLDVDAAQRPGWQEKIDNMSDFPTAANNGKTVFKESLLQDGMSSNGAGDNPVNLHVVFPADAVNSSSPEELQVIARNTVEEMNSWNSGNGFPWIFTAAIRSGYDPSAVWEHLAARLSGPEWRDTNLTLFQYGGGIETFGAIEAINSMLLQSQDGVIRIFPAWPKEKSGSFQRLRARGAFLVDAEFNDGAVRSARIFSEKGGICRVSNPWKGAPLVVKEGNNDVKATQNGDEYAFETTPGRTYVLSK